MGLSTLAIAVGEETETVETVAEPYLVREGLLGRTPRGRIALAPAWTHLGFAVPPGVLAQDPLELFQAADPGAGNTTRNSARKLVRNGSVAADRPVRHFPL